jgi:DNA-directed RNA polymerase subunit F
MIKESKPISMAESQKYLGENHGEIKAFIKKFISLKPEQAKELREKIESLELIKLNEKHVSKIIDVLPENKDVLMRIVAEANLDEDESNVILQTIKEYI